MDTRRFRGLSAHDRALIAVAVLLDGREGATYLGFDRANDAGLKRAALDLAALEPELRMPFVGTLLRAALEELSEGQGGA